MPEQQYSHGTKWKGIFKMLMQGGEGLNRVFPFYANVKCFHLSRMTLHKTENSSPLLSTRPTGGRSTTQVGVYRCPQSEAVSHAVTAPSDETLLSFHMLSVPLFFSSRHGALNLTLRLITHRVGEGSE